ncbi:MAG TPA: response regulator [Myxococcaceae bacterium]|nr:response regulator [Myxococcaceae bacterium]
MSNDPYRYFRVEARELVEQLGRCVLELERGPLSAELASRMLRLAHTLKGAARVVKHTRIAESAHQLEEAIIPFRESGAANGGVEMEKLLRLVDGIEADLAALSGAPGPSDADAGAPIAARQDPEAIRALRPDVADLDALVAGIAEVAIQVEGLAGARDPLERARHVAQVLLEQLNAGQAWEGQKAVALADELRGLLGRLDRQLSGAVEECRREVAQARDAVERIRLVPARALFAGMERTALDAARELGKRVSFEARGGAVRAEADVLSAIQPALVQLVRNAVAHGIEREAERLAAGKPAVGRVVLEISRRGRHVLFRCRDDGRGLDLGAVRAALGKRGETFDPRTTGEELVARLLRGGVSTSPQVTEVSGRGVGLDVVREVAARLGGEVRADHQPGKGLAVELAVPVSMTAIDALLVDASGVAAAIPLDSIQRAVRVPSAAVGRSPDGDFIAVEGEAVPFAPLARVLGAKETRAAAWQSVLVGAGSSPVAVGVDRLLGIATVVVRALPELAFARPVLAGASFDALGTPQLVLDAEGLAESVRGHVAAPAPVPERRRLPVLVIDDSLTTRMLEQSILESAGYEVDLAASAEEGLQMARRRKYGLFLVDVEMPGMDGFAFIETTRNDPFLREVPAILVTSRSSQEDRRRGEAVGAYAYIAKGEFDQNQLLSTLESLAV